MTELAVKNSHFDEAYLIEMRFWCYTCREVHVFVPEQIERIVYALAGAERVALEIGADDPELGHVTAHEPAECLQVVLNSWAADPDLGLDYVEEGVAARKAAEI